MSSWPCHPERPQSCTGGTPACEAYDVYCEHALDMIRSRADRIIGGRAVLVPITQTPVRTISIDIGKPAGHDDRLMHVGMRIACEPFNGHPGRYYRTASVGFIDENATRLDVRELVMPVLIGRAWSDTCAQCRDPLLYPPDFTMSDGKRDHGAAVAKYLMCVQDCHFMHESCYSDNLPF